MARNRNRRRSRGNRKSQPFSQKELKKVSSNLDKQSWGSKLPSGTPSAYKKYERWCEHWQTPIDLLDGLVVHASAWSDRMKVHKMSQKPVVPDIGFYLDDYWVSGIVTSPGFTPSFLGPVTGDVIIYPWQDYAAPDNLDEIKRACEWMLSELGAGKFVDIGCIGGHGRTGSLVACLLVMQGMNPNEAITKVRREYCHKAVESIAQTRFIQQLAKETNPSFANLELTPIPAPLYNTKRWNRETSEWEIVTKEPDPKAMAGTGPQSTRTISSDDGSGIEWWPDDIAWDNVDGDERPRGMLHGHQVDDMVYDAQGYSEDEDDYRQWLELNARGIEANEHTVRQRVLDDYCALAPCIMPDECKPDDGDCFIARTHNREYDPITGTYWAETEGDAR